MTNGTPQKIFPEHSSYSAGDTIIVALQDCTPGATVTVFVDCGAPWIPIWSEDVVIGEDGTGNFDFQCPPCSSISFTMAGSQQASVSVTP